LKDQIFFMQASFGEEAMEAHEVYDDPTPEPEHIVEPDFDKAQIINSAIFQLEESISGNRKQNKVKAPKKREPSALAVFVQEFLLPLTNGLELMTGVYTKYKSEGKLPIFFMTVAGILAILFGVGYLMQYSFQYLGIYESLAKIVLGFLAALISGAIGMKLHAKGENLKEYASALVSLAVILNYLMIFFFI
jgi:hypothetical protein